MADYFASLPPNVAIGLATLIILGISALMSTLAVLLAPRVRMWFCRHPYATINTDRDIVCIHCRKKLGKQPIPPAYLPPDHINCRCRVEPAVKWEAVQDPRTRKQQQAEDQNNGH